MVGLALTHMWSSSRVAYITTSMDLDMVVRLIDPDTLGSRRRTLELPNRPLQLLDHALDTLLRENSCFVARFLNVISWSRPIIFRISRDWWTRVCCLPHFLPLVSKSLPS